MGNIIIGFVSALILSFVFYQEVIKPYFDKLKNRAIHDYVQFMYDKDMLNDFAIKLLAIDVKSGRYDWKLSKSDLKKFKNVGKYDS